MPHNTYDDSLMSSQNVSAYGGLRSLANSRGSNYLRLLRRHLPVMVLITAVTVAIAFLFIALATPRYTATATILISPHRVVSSGSKGLADNRGDDAVIESQASLMQTPFALQRVVEHLNLAADPEFTARRTLIDRIGSMFRRPSSVSASRTLAKAAETLKRTLKINRRGSTYLIDISASSKDRTKAVLIANAVARTYLDDQAQSRYEANKGLADWLRKRLREMESRMTESEKGVQGNSAAAEGAQTGQQSVGTQGIGHRTATDQSTADRLELQREAEVDRAHYARLLARYKELASSEGAGAPLSEASLVAPAAPPASPSFPSIPVTLGLALAIGLGIGLIFALALDLLDGRIKTHEDIEASGLPSIAAIPEISARELAYLSRNGRAELANYNPQRTRLLPAGMQPPLLRYVVTQPMSPFAEAIRAIRFELQHLGLADKTQVISVASAIGGEGKTTVAANLAQSLAMLGIKVILVEGDLRNPRLSRALCPGARSGLLEVALSEMPLNQAVLIDPVINLALLPSPSPEDPAVLAEFASSAGMSGIIAKLRNHFDVVVVDSPPLLPLVDGRALVEQSDAVILTVGWNQTPRSLFLKAVEMLGPIRNRIVGTVLTRVDLRRLTLYEYNSTAYDSSKVYGTAMLRDASGGSRAN
jgi:capsular exopolysaccharide synthesis family protein